MQPGRVHLVQRIGQLLESNQLQVERFLLSGPAMSSPNPLQPLAPASPEVVTEFRREQALRDIGIGLLLLVIGIAITAGTYSAAVGGNAGGTYVLAYGPIIVGVLRLLRGLGRSLANPISR